MPSLYITAATPNPTGKDRPRYGAPTDPQLNEEWIEFANQTQRPVSLANVTLSHYTFDRRCQRTGEDQLLTFTGDLSPGHAVRVHSGRGQSRSEGNRHHLYLNRANYAWNNVCGDTSVLRDGSGNVVDWAQYSPNPPEGQILRRHQGTNQLG